MTEATYGQVDPAAVVVKDGEGRIVQKRTWSQQELNSMSANDYAKLLADKNFVAAIDNPIPQE